MHHLLLDLGALVPMGCVALLFVYMMRGVLRADRHEREALAAFDAQAVIDAVERPVVADAPPAAARGPEGAVVASDVVASVDAPPAPRLPAA